MYCHQCGKEIKENVTYCPFCGLVLCSVTKSRKNKIATGVLALIFGSLGIHRFYLGYKGQGIALLVLWILGFLTFGLTWLVTGIWALVDAIRAFTGDLKDADGNDLV